MVHVTYWILQSDTLALHLVPTLLLSMSCLNLHGFQSTCNPGWSSPVHLPIPSPCPHNLGNKHSCACEKEWQILLLVITVITNFTEQVWKSPLIWSMFSEYPNFRDWRALCPLRPVLFWDCTHHRRVVLCWCFRTTYWSHLQESNSSRTITYISISQTFLLADPFRLRKVTTDPHILAHTNTDWSTHWNIYDVR